MDSSFIFPDLHDELCKIERVADLYAPNESKEFITNFVDKVKTGRLIDVSEEI